MPVLPHLLPHLLPRLVTVAHGTRDGSWAATTYTELIERAGPAGERHATTLSVALDLRTSARAIRTAGGGMKGAAAVLRQEMTTLTAALRAASSAPDPFTSTFAPP